MTEVTPHIPSKPDKNKPWCPDCKLHTKYNMKSPKAGFYSCEICGGNTWKPTLPIPLLIVSLLFILFMFFMGYYVVFKIDDLSGVIMFPLGLFAGRGLYQNYASNAQHWRSFHKWAKKNRQ